jgi:hypothetical protein
MHHYSVPGLENIISGLKTDFVICAGLEADGFTGNSSLAVIKQTLGAVCSQMSSYEQYFKAKKADLDASFDPQFILRQFTEFALDVQKMLSYQGDATNTRENLRSISEQLEGMESRIETSYLGFRQRLAAVAFYADRSRAARISSYSRMTVGEQKRRLTALSSPLVQLEVEVDHNFERDVETTIRFSGRYVMETGGAARFKLQIHHQEEVHYVPGMHGGGDMPSSDHTVTLKLFEGDDKITYEIEQWSLIEYLVGPLFGLSQKELIVNGITYSPRLRNTRAAAENLAYAEMRYRQIIGLIRQELPSALEIAFTKPVYGGVSIVRGSNLLA